MSKIDITRRFAGTQTLYGAPAFDRFKHAHVLVAGVGGVGTWVAEALARTGVGKLTLVDMDVLAESNINRQLPALTSTLGESKIEAMATRIQGINPECELTLVDDFITADSVAAHLTPAPNAVLDCTDDVPAKVALALHCRFNKIKLIMAGGAGGKTDPTLIQVSDLKTTYQDPLLARVRSKLRHECNINKQLKEKFGILCVYSTQPPIVDHSCNRGAGLHCGGYGSSMVMTASIGLTMVSETLTLLAKQVRTTTKNHKKPPPIK